MTCTADKLTAFVRTLGGLRIGSHANTPDCCLLEAVSLCEGRPKTDSPARLDRPDCRPLNDAYWASDELRTSQMLRLAPLLEAWPKLSAVKRAAWCGEVALRMVRDVLPIGMMIFGRKEDADRIRSGVSSLARTREVIDEYFNTEYAGVLMNLGASTLQHAITSAESALTEAKSGYLLTSTEYARTSSKMSANAAQVMATFAINCHALRECEQILAASVQAWVDAAALVAATPD